MSRSSCVMTVIKTPRTALQRSRRVRTQSYSRQAMADPLCELRDIGLYSIRSMSCITSPPHTAHRPSVTGAAHLQPPLTRTSQYQALPSP